MSALAHSAAHGAALKGPGRPWAEACEGHSARSFLDGVDWQMETSDGLSPAPLPAVGCLGFWIERQPSLQGQTRPVPGRHALFIIDRGSLELDQGLTATAKRSASHPACLAVDLSLARTVKVEARARCLVMSLPSEALRRQSSALLSPAPRGRSLPWAGPSPMAVKAAIEAMTPLARERNAETAASLIDELMAAWLSAHVPGIASLSEALGNRYVRRAVEFAGNNLHARISARDLAEAARCSLRNLHLSFSKHLDTTPTAYLRGLRFDRSHALLRSGTYRRVADVASSLGFTCLGRFAAEYRERFGEHPSTTLRSALDAAADEMAELDAEDFARPDEAAS